MSTSFPDPDRTTPQAPGPGPGAGGEPTTAAHEGPRLIATGPTTVPGYEVLGELGRGGMGVVYKARQVALNRTVALKMVLTGEHAGSTELARFLAEAEVVAAVRHPHVVQVFEFGQAGGHPFFAMEHLDGGTLDGTIRAAGRLSPRAAASLIGKLARGVQAVHDLGIVHRDLKPRNVLLDAAGEPKVVDFGLAKRGGRDDLTRTGVVMGTPAYMAPEQAAGKAKFAGPAADIYALGVMLFECLTGRPPFQADDTVSLLLKVAEDSPPPLRDLAPEVSRDLEIVCLKCLAKEPHSRYATARELADDLDRVLAGEPVAARTTGLFGRVAGLLDRIPKETEFAAYGSVMSEIAAATLVVDGLETLVNYNYLPVSVGVGVQYGRVLAYLAIIGRRRRGRLLPTNPAERQLWSIIIGYVMTCLFGSLAVQLHLGTAGSVSLDPFLYQLYAILAALTFFSLGSLLWGWCYAFGLIFLAAACGMAAELKLAPLIFGGTWAAILTIIGARLRRLARRHEPPKMP